MAIKKEFQILNKDSERTWVVCGLCGHAFDARKGGKCKCDNIVAEVDKDGAVMIVGNDSEEVFYDNSK